jgi:hypothetical protein
MFGSVLIVGALYWDRRRLACHVAVKVFSTK